MQPGQISDLVKTAVRLSHHQGDRQEAGHHAGRSTKCSQQLTDQLAVRARAGAGGDLAQTASSSRSRSRPISTRSAKAQGLTVQETGFFARDEPILGRRRRRRRWPRARSSMNDGEVSGAAAHRRAASSFETVTAKQDPYVPKLDEVKDRVRDEVVKQRAREMAKQKAAEVAAKLKTAPRFREGREGRRPRGEDDRADCTRDAPIPDLGVAPAVDRRGVQAAGQAR